MKKRKGWTHDDRLRERDTEIINLYQQLRKPAAVAQRVGCAVATVFLRLKARGIDLDTDRTPWNKLNLDESAVLHTYKREKSLRRTAAAFGCSVPTISSVLKRYGIKADGKPRLTEDGRRGLSKAIKRSHAAGKLRGKNHWNWRGGKKTVACCVCGKKMQRVPSRIVKRPVCGPKCNAKRASIDLRGKNAPMWRGDELLRSCDECGKTYRRTYAKPNKRFCSNPCFYKWLRGKNSHFWRGGRNILNRKIRYIGEYLKWRLAVLERDQYTCQECGQVGGILDAHHKIELAVILEQGGVKTLDEARACEELWEVKNGQTLCEVCHHVEHSQRYALVRQGKI